MRSDMGQSYKTLIGLSPYFARTIGPNAYPYLGPYTAVFLQTWTAVGWEDTLGHVLWQHQHPGGDILALAENAAATLFSTRGQTGDA